MITNALISLGNFILSGLVNLFPTSTGFSSGVFDGADYLGNMVGRYNVIIPVGTLATILGLIIAVELSIFTFKTFKWMFGYIPFIGGK